MTAAALTVDIISLSLQQVDYYTILYSRYALFFLYLYSIICRDTGNRYSLIGTHAVRRLRKHIPK